SGHWSLPHYAPDQMSLSKMPILRPAQLHPGQSLPMLPDIVRNTDVPPAPAVEIAPACRAMGAIAALLACVCVPASAAPARLQPWHRALQQALLHAAA